MTRIPAWNGAPGVRESYLLLTLIREDIRANPRNPRGVLVCVLYRIAHGVLFLPKPLVPFGYVYLAFYKLITEYLLSTELHWRATVGGGLHISHGYGLVVHSNATIGRNCLLRHGVTIGVSHTGDPMSVPRIGDNVEFGAHAIVIGRVTVGNNVLIGAGAVLFKDAPDRSLVVGNPATIKPRRMRDAAETA